MSVPHFNFNQCKIENNENLHKHIYLFRLNNKQLIKYHKTGCKQQKKNLDNFKVFLKVKNIVLKTKTSNKYIYLCIHLERNSKQKI